MSNLRKPSVQFRPVYRPQPINWSLAVRKIGLSLLVVSGFSVYALHQRSEDASAIASVSAGSAASASTVVNPPDQSANQANSPAISVPPTNPPPAANAGFKDGTYTGPSVDAYYGNVQVKATVQGGRITTVQFLDYPHDRRTSQEINQQAMPMLTDEVIQAQTAPVDIISGATFTSQAFDQSLQSALQQAHS